MKAFLLLKHPPRPLAIHAYQTTATRFADLLEDSYDISKAARHPCLPNY